MCNKCKNYDNDLSGKLGYDLGKITGTILTRLNNNTITGTISLIILCFILGLLLVFSFIFYKEITLKQNPTKNIYKDRVVYKHHEDTPVVKPKIIVKKLPINIEHDVTINVLDEQLFYIKTEYRHGHLCHYYKNISEDFSMSKKFEDKLFITRCKKK